MKDIDELNPTLSQVGVKFARLKEIREQVGFTYKDIDLVEPPKGVHRITDLSIRVKDWELGRIDPTINQVNYLLEYIYDYPFIALFMPTLPIPSLNKVKLRSILKQWITNDHIDNAIKELNEHDKLDSSSGSFTEIEQSFIELITKLGICVLNEQDGEVKLSDEQKEKLNLLKGSVRHACYALYPFNF